MSYSTGFTRSMFKSFIHFDAKILVDMFWLNNLVLPGSPRDDGKDDRPSLYEVLDA